MLAMQVPELVPDVEIDGVRVLLQRIHDIGVEHDEVAAEEARGKGVEDAVAMHQIRLRCTIHPQFQAAFLDARVEIGELLRSDSYSGPLDVGNERRLDEQIEDEEEQDVDECDSERAQYEHRPHEQRNNKGNREQRPFVLVYRFHGPSPGFGLRRTTLLSLRLLYKFDADERRYFMCGLVTA